MINSKLLGLLRDCGSRIIDDWSVGLNESCNQVISELDQEDQEIITKELESLNLGETKDFKDFVDNVGGVVEGLIDNINDPINEDFKRFVIDTISGTFYQAFEFFQSRCEELKSDNEEIEYNE